LPLKNLKLMVPDPKVVQQALDQVTETLKKPEYQQQLTKLTQLSVTNSIQTLQKVSKLSQRVSELDNEGLNSLVNNSIGELMRTYLQFNQDIMTLVQKMSNQTVDILEKATPSPKETSCGPQAE